MNNPVTPDGRSDLAAALVTGALALLVALVLAEFLSSPPAGHRINVTVLPQEAKAILAEHPGMPISVGQWRRLDEVMAKHGGWPHGRTILAASIRHSWYWFVLVPLVAVAVLRISRKHVGLLSVAVVSLPSIVALALAFLASRGALA